MELKLNITLNGSFTEMILPVEENMLTIDFYLSLQMLMKSLVDNITTFDIYNEAFQRIALVGEDNELFIDPSYKDAKTIADLNTTTLEVIGLGTRSVRKVLQEERDLLVALENYKQ